MRNKILTLTVCFLFLTIAAQAQKTTTETSLKYADYLAKLKDGDTNIDFKAMRLAYTETNEYSAYGIDSKKRTAMFKALEDKKYKDALKIAEEVLKTNYVEMNAHFIASVSYEELKETSKSEFHKKVFLGLLGSIVKGADGKSAKTAYVVICVPEEYVVLSYLGFTSKGQALASENGSRFDILTAYNEEKKETSKIYFNIDIVFKGYEKIFGK